MTPPDDVLNPEGVVLFGQACPANDCGRPPSRSWGTLCAVHWRLVPGHVRWRYAGAIGEARRTGDLGPPEQWARTALHCAEVHPKG